MPGESIDLEDSVVDFGDVEDAEKGVNINSPKNISQYLREHGQSEAASRPQEEGILNKFHTKEASR